MQNVLNQTKHSNMGSIHLLESLQALLQCHTSSLSIAIWTDWIWGFSWEPSLMVTEVAMTGRDTPQALPSACLERTNTYGTFLSSQSSGRWRMISSGSASAAMTMNSAMPLFKVLVAEKVQKETRSGLCLRSQQKCLLGNAVFCPSTLYMDIFDFFEIGNSFT